MRGALLVVMGCLACGSIKPMHTKARDAQAPSPEDAQAADLTPASDKGADAWVASDDATAIEAPSGCTALAITELPSPSSIVCPPLATAACASQDQGPIFVARSRECLASWGAVPFQCQMWPQLEPGQELIIVPVDTCADVITVHSARLCDGRVEIDFVNQGLCACGAEAANLRLFAIPLDPRPVLATVSYLARPPCLPP